MGICNVKSKRKTYAVIISNEKNIPNYTINHMIWRLFLGTTPSISKKKNNKRIIFIQIKVVKKL